MTGVLDLLWLQSRKMHGYVSEKSFTEQRLTHANEKEFDIMFFSHSHGQNTWGSLLQHAGL